MLSLFEYHISCELGTDRYFVLAGWFSQIKKRRFPSAEMVGLSSGRSELMLTPRFSTLTMVDAVMMLAAWGTNATEESKDVCAETACTQAQLIKGIMFFFTAPDL